MPWGKYDEGTSHHLAHHCADVAACFEVIATLPVVRARMEKAADQTLTPIHIARLAVFAFLHDCGKLHPGFQAKGGWSPDIWSPIDRHGHVQEGAALFLSTSVDERIARNLNVEVLARWGDEEAMERLLHAVIAHHGRPFRIEDRATRDWRAVPKAAYDPVAASAQIGALMPTWFPDAFTAAGPPLPERPAFQHLLCGLVSLADWIGSSRDVFDFVPHLDPDYMNVARAKARRAMAEIGLDAGRWRDAVQGRADFSTLAPGRTPRPAQRRVGDWPLDDPLIILEAETGSGKTEAALWRFARLFEAGMVDGLYFALPTRAAAKQIQGRVHQAMGALFGADAPQAVLAVPGYLKSGEAEGQALPDFKVRWDDEDGNGEPRRLARWAAERANRFLAATIAVGTADQAMLAGLQVKHAHLRAAALSRVLLVIDEVHASDPYMTEIQAALLTRHLAQGGHAMLMSATLGSAARARWRDGRRAAPPALAESIATPYPAIWGQSGPPLAVAESDGPEAQKRVAVTLAPSWSAAEAAKAAIPAATQGARVLVIRNTVTAAMETVAAIRESGGEALLWQVADGPALHHSRFAPEDRRLLDEAVEQALSPTTRGQDGIIVVGTQTLEQSLDIDADVLVTDLCPIDVLLQRIGRLHRHRDLARPAGFDQPHCTILSPQDGLDRLAAPAFDNGLGQLKSGDGIYRNLHACELTRRLIHDHPVWVIPTMNRFLVESATHPDAIAALTAEMGDPWRRYWDEVYGRDLADVGAAGKVCLPVDRPFGDHMFPDDEERIRTRLGAEGVVIRFTEPVVGPFKQRINSITLPAHWSRGMDATEPVRPMADGEVLSFSVGGTRFRYDGYGLARALLQTSS